jgi:hypothetical protein
MFVCCECRVLSGRGLCDELITRPEESYRLRCVVCDLETSRMRRPWLALGRSGTKNNLQFKVCQIRHVTCARVLNEFQNNFLVFSLCFWAQVYFNKYSLVTIS